MPVLSNFDLGNADIDGVFIDAILVPPTASGPPTGLIGVVGGANDGPVGVPTPFSDSSSLLPTFGNDTTSTHSLVRAALNAMPEATQFLGVRVTDGTDVAATIPMPNGGVFATGTLTVAGTPASTNTVTATMVNGAFSVTTPAYTLGSADTVTSTANALVALINASAAVVGPKAFLQPCTNLAGVITIAAAKFGTGGNSITIQGTAVGGGVTITPSTATALSGGTAAGAVNVIVLTAKNTGSNANNAVATFTLQSGSPNNAPVYSLQIVFPGKPTESYNGLVAYSGSGGVYVPAVLQANALAAVNGTIVNRAGSTYWTATAGAANNAPVTSAQQATGGTDGTSGLTTALLLGLNGQVGRTGIYALSGQLQSAHLLVASLTDPAAGQTLITYRQQEDCTVYLSFPLGTLTTQALSIRQANALSDPGLVLCIDWDTVFDNISGTTFQVAPAGKIAGIIASTPSYQYVGNQPLFGAAGVTATERIVAGINQVSPAEAAMRQQNGILYLGYMPRAPRGPQLGLPHGIASDGSTRINDYRMLTFIVTMLELIEGPFVGGAMSAIAGNNLGNPVFSQMQAAANAFFSSLINGQPQQLAAASFTLGGQNTPTTVSQGYLIPTVLVTTMSAAQYIVNLLAVGPGVQAVVTPNGNQ